jgi:hypothetical protein
VTQTVHAVAPQIKYVLTGVSYMTAVIASAVSAAVAAGLAWYVRGRGMAGVQIDLNNAKNEVANLQAKLSAPTHPAA